MRWLVAIPLVLIGLLAVACGSDHAANDVVGPLFIYMRGVGPNELTYEVVTYDLGAQKEVSSFQPGAEGQWIKAALAGDKVVVSQGNQVVLYDLDGSNARVLREAPEGGGIIGIAVSPDATKLAVSESNGSTGQDWSATTFIEFLDLLSGKEIRTIPQSDAGFQGFVGQAWEMTWRDDGQGVVVQGATYSEQPGGTATVMLDGSVHNETLQDYVLVAPNGRYVEQGPMAGLPESTAKTQIVLSDLDSGTDLASVNGEERVLIPYEWSPDSNGFLYASYSLTKQACSEPTDIQCPTLDPSTEQFYLLSTDGSSPRPVSDVDTVRRGWYGDRIIHYRCGDQWFAGPWCSGTQTASLYVGDAFIAESNELTPLGFVDG